MQKVLKISFLAIVGSLAATAFVLYVLFLMDDFGILGVSVDLFTKYMTIILAFTLSLFGFLLVKNKKNTLLDSILLSSALLFTLVSDYFLYIKNDLFEVGLITFIFAQLLHGVRHYFLFKERKLYVLICGSLRILLPIISLIILLSIGQFSTINLLALIYFVQLIFNFADCTFASFFNKENRIQSIVLAVGFLLFIGCDICVFLFNTNAPEAFNYIWLFYTPSQIIFGTSYIRRLIYEN